ncbi:tetratricopeptide repeat protein [Hydrogenophaga defluvii]|uniref:Tetratricopeptide repeat protein n=1 Tax=Hydrogenophaga defluvii TaxID=249410 RepID=A0ABW2SD18_9BURK
MMLRRLIDHLTRRRTNGWTEAAVRDLMRERQFEQALDAAQNLNPQTPDKQATSFCLLGEIQYLRHNDQLAESYFRQALALQASHADAHLGLSMVLSEQQSFNAALEHALFAKNLRPEEPRMLAQLGYCYMLLEAYPAAESVLRLALSHAPSDKRSWNNLAITLRAKGEIAEAKACWLQALDIDPEYAAARGNAALFDAEMSEADIEVNVKRNSDALPELSLQAPESQMPWATIDALVRAGQVNAAINLAEREIPSKASEAETLALNELYSKAGDWQSATTQLQTHLSQNPQHAHAWHRLGKVHARREQHADAISAFRNALGCGGDNANLLAELGASLHALERYQEALTAIQRAHELDGTSKYLSPLASVLLMCCRYEEAVQIYERLGQDGMVKVGANHALSLGYLGRIDEALAILDKLIETTPHNPAVRLMRGQLLLQQHDWRRGWVDYAWRGFSQTHSFRMLPFPRWNGEPLKGKKIVVLAEQGLGDQVMFASCLPDLLALQPAKLVLEAHERVAKTLARSFPDIPVIPSRQKKDLAWVNDLGTMDYFAALGDLPSHFRLNNTAFPKQPYLKADPARVNHWRKRLAEAGQGPWIGFSWKGGTELTRTGLRTMQIQDFAHISRSMQGTWVSLQYGPVEQALKDAKAIGFTPHHWAEAISDLDEFAALVAALDAVVTVCNTTVHYAGSIGKATLVLAPQVPEWRYGLNETHMPWYADVEVIRQRRAGRWDDVVHEAVHRLAQKLAPLHDRTGVQSIK